jgi:HEPN domain-containing protein
MNSRSDIKQTALQKIKDAELLYHNRRYDNAFYLAGYAVELALKARICKNLDIDNLFNSRYLRFFKVHDFDTLLIFSGLLEKFDTAKTANVDLYQNWSYICDWKEDSRYIPSGTKSQAEAERLIKAINVPQHGFLQWIKKYW